MSLNERNLGDFWRLTIWALRAGFAATTNKTIPKLKPPFVGPDKEWLEAFYTLEQLMDSDAIGHNYLQINNALPALLVVERVHAGLIQGLWEYLDQRGGLHDASN